MYLVHKFDENIVDFLTRKCRMQYLKHAEQWLTSVSSSFFVAFYVLIIGVSINIMLEYKQLEIRVPPELWLFIAIASLLMLRIAVCFAEAAKRKEDQSKLP
jgi:ABC-type glycerol-3-phosphate transport system permease component